MSKRTFSWNKVNWEDFQDMCIYLGNKKFPSKDFDHYLVHGQKQDGIDLYDTKAAKNISCIQCKKVEKISSTDLRDFINEFTSNSFLKKTKKFILATTADLHSSTIRAKLQQYKIEFKAKYKIEFDWWDIAAIETQLKQLPQVVKRFFSDYEAEQYCIQQPYTDRIKIEPLPEYIPRLIKEFSSNSSDRRKWDWFEKETTFDLVDVLVESESLQPKKICLVGDPYQGKSFYLQHCAYLLQEKGFEPLFIRVKENTVRPINELLNTNFGYWRSIPQKNLIVFIDGLDEVAATSFTTFAGYINDFIKEHSEIPVIFSCRKFFFEEYKLDDIVKGCKTYELYSLSYRSIESYVRKALSLQTESFWEEVKNKNLEPVLYYPFYLTYLVEEFKTEWQLPATKTDTLKAFVENEFLKSTAKRRLPEGRTIETLKSLYYETLQKLAFALQLSGLNAYPFADIRVLFSREERELLEQSTLITLHNKQWSFINALFQEHLAAIKLHALSPERIIEIVSTGQKVKKVKTKWVQSFSTLLSLMEDSEQRRQLIDFLKNDNPELLFTIEPTKYKPKLRQQFLEELLNRCTQLNVRLFAIYESNIATFIEDNEESIDYLIQLLDAPDRPTIVKVICARTLVILKLNGLQLQNIYKSVQKQIPDCTNTYYAQHLLDILSKDKIGSKQDIEYWITLPLNEKHEFRDGIYKLIMALDLVDDYYNYGLQGVKKLALHNQSIHHGGSEHWLEEFFLSTNRREHLKSLLQLELTPDWIESTNRQLSDFFDKLVKRLHELIERNPDFVFEIVNFIKAVKAKDLYHEFENIHSLIKNDLTGRLLLRLLFLSLQGEGKRLTWEYGALITPDDFDFIFFEFEEGRISLEELREMQFRYHQEVDVSVLADFRVLSMDITGGQLYPAPNPDEPSYFEIQIQKRENDVACLQSREDFKAMVETVFKVFGKKILRTDELYIDSDSRHELYKSTSSIIYQTLVRFRRSDDSVYLSDFDSLISDDDHFNRFRAKQILNYNFSGSSGEESLKSILKHYYDTHIKVADFQNCEWDTQGGYIEHKKLERLLVEIFKKFQFTTPTAILMNMIWLAGGPIDRTEIKTGTDNTRDSVTGLIVERLSDDELVVFKQKILSNLQIGIKATYILHNHIGLCGYYDIKPAKEIIWELINSSRLNVYSNAVSSIDVYLRLGGVLAKVEKLFILITDYNSYLFSHLAKLLKDKNPELVKAKFLSAIESSDTEAQNKIGFARHLANLGVNEGFVYLTNLVREFKTSPYSIQGHIDIRSIDTEFAIKQMKDLMYLIVDPKSEEGSFIDSAKSILLEWMDSFASKSENDLLLIEHLLLQSLQSLSGTSPNAKSHFNWHIIRFRENFRNNENSNKTTIKEVRSIITAIEQ